MVDVERLKGIMREKGVTMDEAAEVARMSPSKLYRCFQTSEAWFTVGEAEALAKLLDMDARTCAEVFLGADRGETEPEVPDMMTFAGKLRELRKGSGKTASEVADAVGVVESAILNYENGLRAPRDDVKKRIADYYGVSVGALFFGEAPDNSGGNPARKVPVAVNLVLALCEDLEKKGYEVEYHISDSSDGNHQIRMEALKRFSRLRWT